MTSPDDQITAGFASALSGPLLDPDTHGYETARLVHNGMIDRRPALIARCTGIADIVDAVNFGRDHGLEIAVKGGGHNVAGNATTDGGLMIDLSLMKGAAVDPVAQTVHAQGGLTWGEFNRETQAFGLATTGGVISTTGIAGLTLGGGLGWLMGTHGMTVDNLRSVQIVTADGQIRTASESENPDLFWAVRGGGGNFGVVSTFEYQLHPVDGVTAGVLVWPIAAARDLLHLYREFVTTLPDELVTFCGMTQHPDGSGTPVAVIVLCHSGDPAAAQGALQPLYDFAPPIVDAVGPISYNALHTMFDDGYPRGALNYWKSNFLSALPDDAIDTLVDQFAASPSPMNKLMLEHFHGAATRVDPTATAFPHRDVADNLVLIGEWLDPAETDANIAWVREAYTRAEPYMGSGRYSNYVEAPDINEDTSADPGPAAYGPNYPRLQQLKSQYDPDNLFHRNSNIRPTG